MNSAPTVRSLRPGLPSSAADERRWEAECGGKDAYTSEVSAQGVLAYIKRERSVRKGCWLTTYQCSFCGGWHLGNTRRVL